MYIRSVSFRRLLIGIGTLFILRIVFLVFGRSSTHHFNDSGSIENIFNETLGFQKIFMINLPSRPDHRDAISLAASLTDLQVDYIDGVTEVNLKTLPPGGTELNLHPGDLGCWRAHMNVLRTMVEQNIASALILEDDADWDIRIKSQMHDFARASRLLVQPLPGTKNRFLDPSYPRPGPDQGAVDFEIGKHSTAEPSTSPYGDIDRWDLFWLGHCGGRFPQASDGVPLGRAVIPNDETVPEPQHLNMQFGGSDSAILSQYSTHTRVVSRASMNTCTVGYAVSRHGAKRILYELALHKLTGPIDMMLRSVCDGSDGRPARTCLTVQPQLFQQHRPVGSQSSFSDISEQSSGYSKQAFTRNIRWSTRLNFAKLVDGQTDYIDLFKDGEAYDRSIGF